LIDRNLKNGTKQQKTVNIRPAFSGFPIGTKRA